MQLTQLGVCLLTLGKRCCLRSAVKWGRFKNIHTQHINPITVCKIKKKIGARAWYTMPVQSLLVPYSLLCYLAVHPTGHPNTYRWECLKAKSCDPNMGLWNGGLLLSPTKGRNNSQGKELAVCQVIPSSTFFQVCWGFLEISCWGFLLLSLIGRSLQLDSTDKSIIPIAASSIPTWLNKEDGVEHNFV